MIFQNLNYYVGLGVVTLLVSAGSITQASPQLPSSGEHSAFVTAHIHLGIQDARVASSRDDDDDDHGNDDRDDDDKRQSPKNS